MCVKPCQLVRRSVTLWTVRSFIIFLCSSVIISTYNSGAERQMMIQAEKCRCETLPTGEKVCDPYDCKFKKQNVVQIFKY